MDGHRAKQTGARKNKGPSPFLASTGPAAGSTMALLSREKNGGRIFPRSLPSRPPPTLDPLLLYALYTRAPYPAAAAAPSPALPPSRRRPRRPSRGILLFFRPPPRRWLARDSPLARLFFLPPFSALQKGRERARVGWRTRGGRLREGSTTSTTATTATTTSTTTMDGIVGVAYGRPPRWG